MSKKRETKHTEEVFSAGVDESTEEGLKYAVFQTLTLDSCTPNGFLPEHIRKVLQDAITKTD